MISVLAHRDFRLLWAGHLVSVTGDMLLFVALPFHVYSLTGSPLATGLTFVAETLPMIVLGPVAGVFVDRWDRRLTMIGADVVRAAALTPLFLVRSASDVWVVYLVAVVLASASQFFSPARQSLLPTLVPADRLVDANSVTSVAESVTKLVGPPVGGALFVAAGLDVAVLVDGLSFLVSLAVLVMIRAQPVREDVALRRPRVVDDLVDGLRYIVGRRALVALFAALVVTGLGSGILHALLIPFASITLQGTPRDFGFLITAEAVGGLLGGLLVGRVARRMRPFTMISCGLTLTGIAFAATANAPSVGWAMVGLAAVGVPAVIAVVGITSLFQAQVADRYRGRVFASIGTCEALMRIVGIGVASALAGSIGIVPLLDAAGVLLVLAALAPLVIGTREADDAMAPTDGDLVEAAADRVGVVPAALSREPTPPTDEPQTA